MIGIFIVEGVFMFFVVVVIIFGEMVNDMGLKKREGRVIKFY